MNLDEAATTFREFVAVVKALRTPGTGCPWDLEQDHRSLRPYLIEEAYEVLDAIDRGDDRAFRDELGDLLLQIVLHAQVAADRGAFSIADVVRGINAKMLRRHPHVFGSVRVNNAEDVRRNWEQIKTAERQAGGDPSVSSALARVPEALPALVRAQRVSEKLARQHGDRRSPAEMTAKAGEQFTALSNEVRALTAPADQALPSDQRGRLENVLGDFLFDLCQLAGTLGLSAEDALRDSTRRHIGRSQP